MTFEQEELDQPEGFSGADLGMDGHPGLGPAVDICFDVGGYSLGGKTGWSGGGHVRSGL